MGTLLKGLASSSSTIRDRFIETMDWFVNYGLQILLLTHDIRDSPRL